MDRIGLKNLVTEIVAEAERLKDTHTDEKGAPVNYACVFCQSDEEYTKLVALAGEIGKVIQDTTKGPLFLIAPLETVAGPLQLLKIRKPDAEHPDRGDADFTVKNYTTFKAAHSDFKVIQKENFEMLELMDPAFPVRVYFSNPPLDQQLDIR